MSSTLWAVKAAKKNKSVGVIPGTSRFITAEMKTNLEIATDGLLSFNQKLQSCVGRLNEVIADINAGATPDLLEKVSLMSLEEHHVKEEESLTSQSYSALTTDRSSTAEAPRLELKLELYERIRSEPNLLLGSSVKQSLAESEIVDKVKPLVSAESPKLPAVEPEPTLPEQLAHKTVNIAPSAPLLPPSSINNNEHESATGNLKTDEIISTALSPIHIPRAAAPLTSPNVDLSFIPIANTINPQKYDKIGNSDAHDETLESDTSFQAISTAIRKSFAGKLSMGQFAGSLPLHSEFRDEPEAKLEAHDPFPEHQADHDVKPRPQPRERSIYAKRSSVFVALPDREPISYLNSTRQSIKVKSEDSDDKVKTKGDLALPANTSQVPEQRVSKNTEDRSKTTTNIARNLDLRIVHQREESSSSQANKSKISSRPAKMSTSTNVSRGAITRIPARSRSPTKDGTRSKLSMMKRYSSRTTDSGSPNRGYVSAKIPPPSQGQNGTAAKNVFSLETDDPSSVNSSRSPTKYSHLAEGSIKDSPTDYKDVLPPIKTEPEFLQRLTLPTTASIAKSSKLMSSKDPLLKNRFLTTTLNPDRPPQFAAARSQLKKSSPVKRTANSNNDKTSQDSKLGSVSLKYESTSRPKQKINLSINHAQERRSNHQKTGSSPTQKLVTSPKRKERFTIGKLDFQRKSLKRGPDPPDIYVAPRKRAIGNAVPLPDAARGKFKVERSKEKQKSTKPLVTPSKSLVKKSSIDPGFSGSSEFGPDALPDIPSDDEALRNKKYLKSWAETPELLRVMKENKELDPVAVFGDVPVLKMDDVFDLPASRHRAIASPKLSP